MSNNKFIVAIIYVLIFSTLIHAATLKGTIYNSQLNPETNVLLEINSQPLQKYLAKDGTYQFSLENGKYSLTAQKNDIEITEQITITKDGTYLIDLFLLPDSQENQDLWNDIQDEPLIEPLDDKQPSNLWRYILIGIIILALLIRILYMRKKYGSLSIFRKRIRAESQKNEAQHKQELEQQPSYIEKALKIIKSHDGRINQKELRKEMLYLSEAKVSLIITELEHKGLIEKIKKGRGNVIILKEKVST